MITYNKGRKTAILDDSAGQACICLQRYQHLDGRRSRDRNMAAPMKWERESSILHTLCVHCSMGPGLEVFNLFLGQFSMLGDMNFKPLFVI